MTCEEFERVLPELKGGHNLEQEEHLETCSACADLVSDLNAIEQNARLLEEYEPSPRVWNSIESALGQEGLIRQPQLQLVLVPAGASSPRWRFAWLLPIAAALVFGAGLFIIHQRVNTQFAQQQPTATPVQARSLIPDQGSASNLDEDPVIKVIAAHAPAMRESYKSDLRAVEAYIRDAEVSARDNPNDEIAQQYLTNAYEQRAMVYEMAMHRTLP